MLIHGKCHCGNIAFDLELEGDAPEIPARACGCSFCVKHGGVWTSHPKATLAVTIVTHSFHPVPSERGLPFHICARCGAVPLVTSEVAGHPRRRQRQRARGRRPARLRRQNASFEGEDVESACAQTAQLDRRCSLRGRRHLTPPMRTPCSSPCRLEDDDD